MNRFELFRLVSELEKALGDDAFRTFLVEQGENLLAAVAMLEESNRSGELSSHDYAQCLDIVQNGRRRFWAHYAAANVNTLAPPVDAEGPIPSVFPYTYERWLPSGLVSREEAFANQYAEPDVACLLVNSGMASINLAYTMISRHHFKKPIHFILVGGAYKEGADYCRQIAASRPDTTIDAVSDTQALCAKWASAPPEPSKITIVYADAIENSCGLRLFDRKCFLQAAARYSLGNDGAGYLLLDRTLVGHRWNQCDRTGEECKECRSTVSAKSKWTTIETESTTKYHQQGADLAPGGAVYVPNVWAAAFHDPILNETGLRALWRLRGSMSWTPFGANFLAYPRPDQGRQEAMLLRHQRNATIIAAALSHAIAQQGAGRWQVFHPSLDQHPDHTLARRLGTSGGLVFLKATLSGIQASDFIKSVKNLGWQHDIFIEQRTSFGFAHTSLNPVTTRAKEQMVRISAGTETSDEVKKVADILACVV